MLKKKTEELFRKLAVVDAELFVKHFWLLNDDPDVAYETISQIEFPVTLDFQEEVETAISIINDGYTRETLQIIINDPSEYDAIREEAFDLLMELEESGFLEENLNDSFKEEAEEEEFETIKFVLWNDGLIETPEAALGMKNVSVNEAIADYINKNPQCSVNELVLHLDLNSTAVHSCLMDMIKDGEVNCMEGLLSLGIGYELKDNYIYKLMKRCEEKQGIAKVNCLDLGSIDDYEWDDDEDEVAYGGIDGEYDVFYGYDEDGFNEIDEFEGDDEVIQLESNPEFEAYLASRKQSGNEFDELVFGCGKY